MAKIRCLLPNCGWDSGPIGGDDKASIDVAGCLSTWHVFEKHYDVWREQFGDSPPLDPDPRTPEGLTEIILWGINAL